MNINKIEKKVVKILKRAGKIYHNQEFFEAVDKYKYENDDVTSNDILTQEYIKGELLKLIPNSSFIGEEGEEITDSDYSWVLDPIDGTLNYKSSIPIYATQLALNYKGKALLGAIYFPAFNEVYIANRQGAWLNNLPIKVSNSEDMNSSVLVICSLSNYTDVDKQSEIQTQLMRNFKSMRLFGCAAFNYALCASGKADAVVVFGNTPWDLEPGHFLVEMAGGVTYSNKKLNMHISGNSKVVSKIKKLFKA